MSFCLQTVLCVHSHLRVVFVLPGFEQDSCNTVIVLVWGGCFLGLGVHCWEGNAFRLLRSAAYRSSDRSSKWQNENVSAICFLWCLDSFQLCLWLYVCWADSISTMIHIYTILWMESWPRREDRLACWPVWRDSYGFSPGGTNFFYLDLRNGSTQKKVIILCHCFQW